MYTYEVIDVDGTLQGSIVNETRRTLNQMVLIFQKYYHCKSDKRRKSTLYKIRNNYLHAIDVINSYYDIFTIH